ncbi:MAG: methyltransferase [Deltaproteobacteria bacterium]|nr:methyltransferase [Deltaproteobacteria bacterium]
MTERISTGEVERWLNDLYVAAEGARLRAEDRRKAVEVAAMLDEVRLALARTARTREVTLVDAAAGKAYVGLLAARLVLEPLGRRGRVVALEREPGRAAAARAAAGRLGSHLPIECLAADVGDPAVWPAAPDLVVALHACGPAADAIIDRATAVGARRLLLVPCCTGAAVTAASVAEAAARTLGVPRHAPVRRRVIQAMVDAERTLGSRPPATRPRWSSWCRPPSPPTTCSGGPAACASRAARPPPARRWSVSPPAGGSHDRAMNFANRFGNTFDAALARGRGEPGGAADASLLDLAVVAGVFVGAAAVVAPAVEALKLAVARRGR